MLNYSHENTQYPVIEQAAHGHCETWLSSHKGKDGRFYVITFPVAPGSKPVVGVRHPFTKKPLAFLSRRAADTHCDLLNSQFAQAR